MSSVDASGSIYVDRLVGGYHDPRLDNRITFNGTGYNIDGSGRGDKIELVWNADGSLTVIFNDEKAVHMTADEAKNIVVSGGGGDDTIFVTGDTPAGNSLTMHGNDGNDLLIGSDGVEIIGGEKGDDRIFGLGGNDEIHGGKGADYMRGGAGDDMLYGGSDNAADVYYGDAGTDRYSDGGSGWTVHWDLEDGTDQFALEHKVENGDLGTPDERPASSMAELDYGARPNPNGGASEPPVDPADPPPVDDPTPTPEEPTPAPEEPTPAPEEPTPAPEEPAPAPEPAVDEDIPVYRYNGSDYVSEQYGFSVEYHVRNVGRFDVEFEGIAIKTGDGNDTVELVWHKDGSLTVIVNGETSIHLNAEDAKNVWVYGQKGNDTITVTGDTPAGNQLILDGGRGDDLIVGSDGEEILIGYKGNDRMYGQAGNDRFYGGDGNDLMVGGAGNDYLHGMDGSDTAHGDAGTDTFHSVETAHWDPSDNPSGNYNHDLLQENPGEGSLPDDLPESDIARLNFRDAGIPDPRQEGAEAPVEPDPVPEPEVPEPPEDCGDTDPEPVIPITNASELGVAVSNVGNSATTADQQAGIASAQANLAEQQEEAGDTNGAVISAGQANLAAKAADRAADDAEAEFDRIDAYVTLLEADPDCDPAVLASAQQMRADAMTNRDAARANADAAQVDADRAERAAGIDLPDVDDADEIDDTAPAPGTDAADAEAADGTETSDAGTAPETVTPTPTPEAGGAPADAESSADVDGSESAGGADTSDGYAVASDGTEQSGSAGGETRRRARSGNWLVQLASALGEMQAKFLSMAMKNLDTMSEISDATIDSEEDPTGAEQQRREFLIAQSEFQANMQMFNLMAQATATSIRSIGEGNSAVARKN